MSICSSTNRVDSESGERKHKLERTYAINSIISRKLSSEFDCECDLELIQKPSQLCANNTDSAHICNTAYTEKLFNDVRV